MKNRQYRKRRKTSSSSEDEESSTDKVKEVKEDQKFRIKPKGINALALAVGKPLSKEEVLSGDSFRGTFNKKGEGSKEKYGLQVCNSFSAESSHREEDQLMNRYIEQELAKRRGVKLTSEVEDQYQQRINELFKVPEHLQTNNRSMTEDMLSDQVLTGIPEVDLGLDAKIENIEKTDEAVSSISKRPKTSGQKVDDDDDLPRNYTHDYARLDKINKTKTTLNILKDDRYI